MPGSREEIEVEEPPPGWVMRGQSDQNRGPPASSRPALFLRQQAGPFRPATRTLYQDPVSSGPAEDRDADGNYVYVPSFQDREDLQVL